MTGAPAECDVNLFRPRLRRAAPFERAVYDRVHLIEPPSRARSAAGSHGAARFRLALFEAQFYLCRIHAHKCIGEGWTNTGVG